MTRIANIQEEDPKKTLGKKIKQTRDSIINTQHDNPSEMFLYQLDMIQLIQIESTYTGADTPTYSVI